MDLVRMLIAAAAALVIGIPFLLATRRVRPAGEKMAREAWRQGRVAEGVLADKVYLPPDMGAQNSRLRQNRWRVRYDYEVDGVAYSYKCTLGAPVPERVSLYYPEGRPDRAEIWGAVQRRRGPAYTLRALVPVAVWAAVYWLLALAEVGGGA
mgnify:FL=1